ncbi:MAG TPA: hypothetical protein VF141_21085 [Chryseolinea sp.]
MKPLAANNILNALFFPTALFLVVCLFTIGGVTQIMIGNPFTILLIIGLIVWIYFGVRDARNLYYDDEFVYIEGLFDNSRVPLSRVTRIAKDLTGMRATGVTAWRYRLEFAVDEKVAVQTFYEVDGGTRVDTFVTIVRKINPSVVIK